MLVVALIMLLAGCQTITPEDLFPEPDTQCGHIQVQYYNKTFGPLLDEDFAQFKDIQKADRCSHWMPQSPCLKAITKTGTLNYHVTCGTP